MFCRRLLSFFAPVLSVFLLTIANSANAQTALRPFPQTKDYVGKIKPNHVSQSQLNANIASYFSYWKTTHVRQSNGVTPGGGYYVSMKGVGGTGTEITTSEAHGYGMILFALMAGYDVEAKKYFDGMFNMYDKHRSTGNSNLMSWIIDQSESASADSASATDGDMDIAYALLLAHYQWGSSGAINYLSHAKRIINLGLKGSSVNLTSKRTTLGDWDQSVWSTRSSDWMTGHMHAYFHATGDLFWNDVADTAYGLIDAITLNYASGTGLMPDFVVATPPKPASAYFLEAATDGQYSWNACRYPLRIAMDSAHFQNLKAKKAMTKLVGWIENATAGQPSGILAGYQLNGAPLVGYNDMAFTAPLTAAATVADGDHQAFVNRGWNLMAASKGSYYDDSINLLSMLFVSGNWWAPVDATGSEPVPAPPPPPEPTPVPTTIVAKASSDDGIHFAQYTLDGSLAPESRWSANGYGQWVEYDLGQTKTVAAVDIAFYLGNQRRYSFDIYAGSTKNNLTRVFSGRSSGASLNLQRFDFRDRTARYVRIVGYGNNSNRSNALTEVKIITAP